MGSRFTGPAIAAVAIVLLVMAAWSSRWLVAEVRTPNVNADVRVGLTGLKVCVATAGGGQCQSAEWSDIPGIGGVGSWVWLSRLTFIGCLATAAGLLLLSGLKLADIDVRGALSLPRIVSTASIVLIPLSLGVWFLSPSGLRALEAGRGLAFALVGALAAAIAASAMNDRE